MRVPSLGVEDPTEGKWQPTPVFLPEKFHGERSLVGYSPCGLKESDTNEAPWHAFVLADKRPHGMKPIWSGCTPMFYTS